MNIPRRLLPNSVIQCLPNILPIIVIKAQLPPLVPDRSEIGVPLSGSTHAVVRQSVAGRAQGWSDPSGVNNKQLCTMDIEAEYLGYIKS